MTRTMLPILTVSKAERSSANHARGVTGGRLAARSHRLSPLAAGLLGLMATTALTVPATAQAPKLVAPNAQAAVTPTTIPDLVERVSPAVVSVLVEREVERPRVADPFQQFFRFRFPDDGGQSNPFQQDDDDFEGETERLEAQGSGFFIDADGHVVTNQHVVEGADVIRIRLSDGEELDAELVGTDLLTDLAVLKVSPPKGQAFVQFADDVKLRVGETVVAIGNPFGLGGTVTSGIVSAIGGQNRQGQFLDFIQIDAPINRGNSGGPTFDLQGRVVGVNRAIYSPNGGSVGIGFAIPAPIAGKTVAQLIQSGRVIRGFLGVEPRDLDASLAAALGRKDTKGALVNNVIEGPAADAGIEAGDLILSVNGKDIDDASGLSRTIAAYPPGEKVKVVVLRDSKQKTIQVTLGDRPDEDAQEEQAPSNDNEKDAMASSLGLRVSDLNDTTRAQYRIPDTVNGAVVTGVRRGSHAAEAGLRPGVVIIEADGDDVTSRKALEAKVDNARKEGKEALFLRVQIGNTSQFTAIKLDAAEG